MLFNSRVGFFEVRILILINICFDRRAGKLGNKMEENCPHSVMFGSLCVKCGQTIEKEADVIRGVHSRADIWVQKNQLEEKHKASFDLLMKDKKLVAILDLDHTLIHAVDAPRKEMKGSFHTMTLKQKKYLVKLRPGLDEFLTELSKDFELHVFTHGMRNYAKGILSILDPSKKYFHDRVVSRDDIDVGGRKTLSRIFPFSSHHVVIVDDLAVVWDKADSRQVIQITPYKYFIKGKKLLPDTVEDDQHALATVLTIMQTVRRIFFAEGSGVRDVSAILARMNARATSKAKSKDPTSDQKKIKQPTPSDTCETNVIDDDDDHSQLDAYLGTTIENSTSLNKDDDQHKVKRQRSESVD
eukprot:TRINITY_DN31306_c0_g1_i1.p1 TRINITY_DN31306_c0_g1~~TRINITY_DN31306_c0_g1_i1.p1  ORF type:complete len:356 (+),score=37.40 TRINITY_DN31306_c0_g1_i1:39-1106(+)